MVRHARKKQPASSKQSRQALQLSTVPHQPQQSSFDEPSGYLNDHMAPNVQTGEANIARVQRMQPTPDDDLGYLNDHMTPKAQTREVNVAGAQQMHPQQDDELGYLNDNMGPNVHSTA